MNEIDVRMECLRLAASLYGHNPTISVIDEAAKLYSFVTNNRPSEPAPMKEAA